MANDLKNIQIIDGADNATYSIFEATDEEFYIIFPRPGQDLEIVEAVFRRLGQKKAAALFPPIWQRPILKPNVQEFTGRFSTTTSRSDTIFRRPNEKWTGMKVRSTKPSGS